MTERDVILCAYACSAMAPCHEWKDEFFGEPPIVINIPGSGSSSFRAKVLQWAGTGDLFMAAVKERAPEAKDIKIRRRGLVTFSAGWNFADELFKNETERNRLDAYLLLDGCHTRKLDNWIKYAVRAVDGKAFMAMAHTMIQPPFASTTETNTKIFDDASGESETPCAAIPDHVLYAELPEEGHTISLGAVKDKNGRIALPAIKKTWKEDPLVTYEKVGDLTRLHYSGNDRPDHVYIAWHVSKRLWKWLGEWWSKSEEEVVPPPEPPVTPPEPPVDEEPDVDPPKKDDEETDKKDSQNVFQSILKSIMMLISKIFGKKS